MSMSELGSQQQAVATMTLAITGASGAHYALRLLQALVANQCRVYLLVSHAAGVVINTETKYTFPDELAAQQQFFEQLSHADKDQIRLFDREDWFAPVASGSAAPRAMVVCPASGGSISAIAHGASNNLIERAADVMLKERRQLILVPRETPFSSIHLDNMLTLSKMGATILPACPGFYHQPKSVEDMVDFIVARILDHLNLPQTLIVPWGKEL